MVLIQIITFILWWNEWMNEWMNEYTWLIYWVGPYSDHYFYSMMKWMNEWMNEWIYLIDLLSWSLFRSSLLLSDSVSRLTKIIFWLDFNSNIIFRKYQYHLQHNSVMQSDGNSFGGDVVLENIGMRQHFKPNLWEQKYFGSL